MTKYKAIQIAHWFINRSNEEMENGGDKISMLKLQKLLYYADGCNLALYGEPLFQEKIYAWEHGPVVPEVYHAYDDAFNLVLTIEDIADAMSIEKKDQELLEEVFQTFGSYSAWGLRNKTHKETPWIEATDNGRVLNGEINRETMKKYFAENYISDEEN